MPARSHSVYRATSPGRVTFAAKAGGAGLASLDAVETATLRLIELGNARTAQGRIKTSAEYTRGLDVSINNGWTRVEYPPVASGIDPGVILWMDVWVGAMKNLAALAALPLGPGVLGHDVTRWVRAIRANLALYSPASNLLPTFFSVMNAPTDDHLIEVAPPLPCQETALSSRSADLPKCLPFGFGSIPGHSGAGVGRLATRTASRGGAVGKDPPTLGHPEDVMSYAPVLDSAGFAEALGPLPVYTNWWWSQARAVRGGAVVRGWFGGSAVDPAVAAVDLHGGQLGRSFNGMGLDSVRSGRAGGTDLLVLTSPAEPELLGSWSRGWDAVWSMWARTTNDVVVADGRYPAGSRTNAVVVPGAFIANWRAMAAYYASLNLVEVLERTVGFYGTSYVGFAQRMGYPAGGDLGEAAAGAARMVQAAAAADMRAAGGAAGGTATAIAGAISQVSSSIGVIATIYSAVVGLVTSLIADVGGSAVGNGVVAAQPIFVRGFINMPIAEAELVAIEDDPATDDAARELLDRRREDLDRQAVPWVEIGLGLAAAVVLGFGVNAVLGGRT